MPPPHPVDQAKQDEQDQDIDRMGERLRPQAGGDLVAADIGEAEQVDERDLPLQRAVALAKQRPAERRRRFPDVEKAAQRASAPHAGRLALDG